MTNEVKGVGKCPYSPLHNSTAVLVGDRLYAGTTADYQVKNTFLFTGLGRNKYGSVLDLKSEGVYCAKCYGGGAGGG